MALQGTLDTFALPDVLRLLAATHKTGRVHVTGPRGTGSVWMEAGGVGRIEAPNAPHALEPVDALFELLRFDQGSFTFDGDVTAVDPSFVPTAATIDVESLLGEAETLLVEWREIESVVPSMDAWVTLRRDLVAPTVSVDRSQWTTVVAIGGGATVRRMSDELRLSELPVSRAVRDLVLLGLADIDATAPAQTPVDQVEDTSPAETASAHQPDAWASPVDADPVLPALELEAPLPVARPLRARRPRSANPEPTSSEPESFVPLEILGHAPAASYDPLESTVSGVDAPSDATPEDPAALFPGLSADAADDSTENEDLTRQLAMLSPRAAEAVRAAAAAATEEERDAALADAEAEDSPINRGLLLKFLSSVKS